MTRSQSEVSHERNVTVDTTEMRLRVCCYCDGEEKGASVIEIETGPPLTDQPRRGESIQLERITNQGESVNQPSNTKESSFSTTTPVTQLPTSFDSIKPIVSASSNFKYISKNGDTTKMTFEQVDPECYRGTYKGSQFTIVNGKLQPPDGAYSQPDKELILKNYSQAILAMQQGIIGIEARLLGSLNQQLPSLSPRQLEQLPTPDGSKINVNFTTETGKKSKMTFKQIKPGLFRGTYNDNKEFSIANGQILTLDGNDQGLNKDLILSSFYRAILGVQQTKLGMQKGEWAIESRLSGSQLNPMELLKAACPERRQLFETKSLEVHNEFRKIHGVPPLVHSEFLCELAREWAEHLALKDTSYQRPNNEYGENLYYSHGVALDARKVVTTWYDEINLYNYNDPQLSKDTGHFTQLIWKDTREMGTGIAQLGDKVWVCCYYHPTGNIPERFSEKYIPRPKEVA